LPGISEKTAHFFSVSNANSLSVCHALCIYLRYELRNYTCGVFPVGLAELNNDLLGAGRDSRYQRHDPTPILVSKNFTTEIEAG